MGRAGAQRLRTFLQDLLETHIEKELPKAREEIKRQLHTTEAELSTIGIVHIRHFLTSLSITLHRLTQAALNRNYQGPDMGFSKAPGTRLRVAVHKYNGDFSSSTLESEQKRKAVPRLISRCLNSLKAPLTTLTS
jgi:chemotaxis protein histidine kinase CheA